MFTLMPVAAFASDENVVEVSTADQFLAATTGSGITIKLAGNITVNLEKDTTLAENTRIVIESGKTLTLNLNEKTLSGSNTATATHNFMIDVKGGTLNIENGQIVYKHTGSDMSTNGAATVIDVTGGGVLNMDGVNVSVSGTFMNFCVHLNNWGEVTLNADNCVFDSTYCGVRVFNSGPDMNNVKITNSTLKGTNRAFWVHNYVSADMDGKVYSGASATYDKQVVDARLNLDIYNNNNKFEVNDTSKTSPIRYGFKTTVFYDETGSLFVTDVAGLKDAIAEGKNVVLANDIESSEIITINKPITLDGKGKTLTYTGSNRAVDVPKEAEKADVTIKNLIVNCTGSYCERGINYNTDGVLTLDKVTVKGANLTYALNFPISAVGAKVEITDSDLAGCIALNIWAQNMIINVTNTNLTSIDKNESEGYAAIQLNNDGTYVADGTEVTVVGGSITAQDDSSEIINWSTTGKVNVSGYEVESVVALINYGLNSYGYTTLDGAVAKAKAGEKISLVGDVTLDKALEIPENVELEIKKGKAITLEKGVSLTVKGTSNIKVGENIFAPEGCYEVKVEGNVYSAVEKHDYKAEVTAPTCTEPGYTTYTCACGKNYKADEVEKKGHSYGGWTSVDSTTHQRVCSNDSTHVETGAHDFNAENKCNDCDLPKYTVTFKYAERLETVKVISGDKVTAPEFPVITGMAFDGWYNGETEYDFSKPVTSNLTLIAEFTPVYAVTFDSNGGSGV